jgi:hypothetical protein
MCLLIKQPNYDFSGYPNAYCLILATLMLCEIVSIAWFLVVKYMRGRMRLRTAQQNSGDSNCADSVWHEAYDIRHYNSLNSHLQDFPPAYSENIEMTTPSHRTSGTPPPCYTPLATIDPLNVIFSTLQFNLNSCCHFFLIILFFYFSGSSNDRGFFLCLIIQIAFGINICAFVIWLLGFRR